MLTDSEKPPIEHPINGILWEVYLDETVEHARLRPGNPINVPKAIVEPWAIHPRFGRHQPRWGGKRGFY